MIAEFLLRAIPRMISFYCMHRKSFHIHSNLMVFLSSRKQPFQDPKTWTLFFITYPFSLAFMWIVFFFFHHHDDDDVCRKGFLCKFVLKSPSFFGLDISYMKISPRNVLTFIIKNNFMCFVEEIYRKVNVLKFSPHSFLSRLDHSLVEKYIFYVLWCVLFDTASHSDPYGSIQTIHIKMKCWC